MSYEFGNMARGIRANPRYSVELRCEVNFAAYHLFGVITNISVGGARIKVAPAATHLLRGEMKTLWIEDLGTFAVTRKWYNQRSFGVSFANSLKAREVLTRFLRDRDLEQQPYEPQ